MSSIIEGYSYDIFISYRQKDNKYDGWVTEFVDNLKKELEATFKEEISVYFDINPHDGLLETHDVDASLKEKLKCLIFIPVISRTYCDPKSFAWEYEFKAFVEQASQDKFGLKVKLPTGNVANRVLPVRIHELDTDDIKLCETVLNSMLRGVQFIYSEPGVNRPLKTDDDEKVNLNKTRYRNQINKVANAIKEIITGIKNPEVKSQTERSGVVLNKEPRRKLPWTKIAVPAIIVTLLLIIGLMISLPVIKKASGGASEIGKSIAVLPFDNLSNDPDQEYFSVGMVDEILDKLFKIGDLNVIARTSSERFKTTNLSLKEFAHELGVATILEGSVRKMGANVRITVQLIDARTEAHIWSEIYDRDISDIFSIQSEVAQTVARELKAVITPEAKKLIENRPTSNMEAYEAYRKGMFYYGRLSKNDFETAMKYFELAKEKDPGFALAYAGIGRVWRGRE
jgi:TolB-like protein